MAFSARTYERPYYLLCEGQGDKLLFDRMLERMALVDQYTVEFPDRAGELTGGRSKFGSKLSNLYTTSSTFRENVKGVLVVSDNDADAAESWREVVTQLTLCSFPVPSRERIIARKIDYPPVGVLMLPIGENGNLETLCLRAAYDKWPIGPAVESFADATPARDWTIGKQSKMKLQAVIAATCKGRPEAGFTGHWRENADYHIPLSHLCFRPVEDFLRDFPTLVAAT